MPYAPAGERFATLQIRLPPELLAWIDGLRTNQKIAASRAQAIRYLIEQGRAVEEAAARSVRDPG
jgi:hypothetical protein